MGGKHSVKYEMEERKWSGYLKDLEVLQTNLMRRSPIRPLPSQGDTARKRRPVRVEQGHCKPPKQARWYAVPSPDSEVGMDSSDENLDSHTNTQSGSQPVKCRFLF